MTSPRHLRLRGARCHNLAGVDLDLPLGAWIAVTGPSGSGKSSLARDTVLRESERRYLGSLSPRARQVLGKLGGAELDALDGLPVALPIGEGRLAAGTRSTVGTQTGVLDLLRLLFARVGDVPADLEPLLEGGRPSRSHFSFNHPAGACESCGGLGLEDLVDPALLVADATRSIKDGALVPTLPNGYTVYSQVTLEVMDTICGAHGFDVDTPWQDLTDEQRDVVLFGTQALKVPFGKHPIESRMKWEGITARPREEGYYRGLVPVIEETLQRNRNTNVLRFVRSVACGACEGTRLGAVGRTTRVGKRTLPELLALEASELRAALDGLPPSPVLGALRPGLDLRMDRLVRLGLGHLSLDRTADGLSDGEAQRVRLVARLGAGLGGMLAVLDEPTLGLHPSEQAGMAAVLEELRAQGNTLLVVEHDPDMVRHAGHLVELGPGAGPDGGRVVFAGATPDEPLGGVPAAKASPRAGDGELVLSGASLHNLRDAELRVAIGAVNVVVGPSGAGKSSLVFGTLLPALEGKPGGAFDALEVVGASAGAGPRAHAVDARPIGRNPRSTPATWSGLFDLVRKRFAATDAARAAGFKAGRFSFNNKDGRCPGCEGLGVQRIGLHLLEDVELDCPTCGGGRYEPGTLAVRLPRAAGAPDRAPADADIAEVLAMDVTAAARFFAGDAPVASLLDAMQRLGLGYLRLGQSSKQLSRGESQRVKLATLLGSTGAEPSLLLLDEPDRGLHPADVARLVDALDALVEAGHTVVAISHHRQVWAAADRCVELRDGVARVARHDELGAFPSERVAPADPVPPPAAIELRGVRTHNLQDLDVTIPHRAVTVVSGPSGSGKSSLVHDTLAAEAWARFGEGLPFQARRFMRRLPRPDLDEARGLTPVLVLGQGGRSSGAGDRRSTVATQSELGPLLRLLWSRAGALDGAPALAHHGLTAEHFSRDRSLGACPACAGRAVVGRCDPALLVTDPTRPLAAGALAGTKPGAFFSDPDDQHMAVLRTALVDTGVVQRVRAAIASTAAERGVELGDLAEALGVDPGAPADLARALVTEVPWQRLPADVRSLALDGAGERRFDVTWSFAEGASEGTGAHHFEGTWDGLLALVEREAARRARSKAAATWLTPIADRPCEACAGSGLGDAAARTTIGSWTLPALLARPLAEVAPALDALAPDDLDPRAAAALAALLPELRQRLDELVGLSLGHLALDRPAASLSDGELQRVRLAGVLRSGLTGVTLALDEPDAGLHARDVGRLAELLAANARAGNTPVVVSHRRSLQRAADHHVVLGPGAGAAGGRLVEAPGEAAPPEPSPGPAEPPAVLHLRGCHAHNLTGFDLGLPTSGLVCVTGVSGSGKSTLLHDVVGASFDATLDRADGADADAHAVTARGCDSIVLPVGHPGFARVRGGRRRDTTGGTLLGTLDLGAPLQRLLHDAAAAEGLDLPRAAFSPASPKGRCETCKGSGVERVALDVLADLDLPCPACGGRRFRPEVLAARWRGLDPSEVLELGASELRGLLEDEPGLGAGDDAPSGKPPAHLSRLAAGLDALARVGLGHLSLGRRRRDLSGGERQRLDLAAGLAARPKRGQAPSLYLLDEPARGLHADDIARLVEALGVLTARGDLVLSAAHRLDLIAAADHVVDLGPGGGPAGGRVVATGAPAELTAGATAAALAAL